MFYETVWRLPDGIEINDDTQYEVWYTWRDSADSSDNSTYYRVHFIEEFGKKEQTSVNDLSTVIRVILKMDGPKMWGLHPEKGWKRPSVIKYDGEWYVMVKEDNEYFQDRYYNFNQDVADGIYVPTGVKVGEE